MAVNAGDVRTALAVEDSQAKLCGLFAPRTLKVQGAGKNGAIPVEVSLDLNYDDLRKLPPDELVRLHRQTIGVPLASENGRAGEG
jgi:hypothetical protein